MLPFLYMLPLYTFLVCFLLKEGEGERRGERVRINRLTFYIFKEGRRKREREGDRERIDLHFVFFKEGRRREREKKEEEEEEEERR
jgi:hypothetical protein